MAKTDTVAGVVTEPAAEEYCTKPYFDDDGVQVASGIGPDGKEYPDPVPFSVPLGYQAPPDLMTMIKQMVHSQVAQTILDDAGMETFDEADDFDIEDDPIDPLTPYESVFFPKPEAAPPTVAAPPSPSVAPPATGVAAPAEGAVASPPPGTPSNSTVPT